MFNNRRQAIQARPSITPPKQSSCKCNISIIVVIIVIILCSLSLYLSTHILQQSNNNGTRNLDAVEPSKETLPDILIQKSLKSLHKLSNPENDPDLSTKLKKSMEYLLRDGHMDRVEYMIGFRGDRFTQDSQYSELNPRDINKKYVSSLNMHNHPCTQSLAMHITIQ